MTNQEKRTKSGQLILDIVQGKTAATVQEVEKKTKLPHEEVVSAFKALEDAGMGRFIVGRRGQPSRFVRFADARAEVETPVTPLDVKVKNIYDNGRVELHFTADPGYLGELLARLKRTGIATTGIDFSEEKPIVIVMVDSGKLGETIKALRNGNQSLS